MNSNNIIRTIPLPIPIQRSNLKYNSTIRPENSSPPQNYVPRISDSVKNRWAEIFPPPSKTISPTQLIDIIAPENISRDEFFCPICRDKVSESGRTTQCGHKFCCQCISTWLMSNLRCPMCNYTFQN